MSDEKKNIHEKNGTIVVDLSNELKQLSDLGKEKQPELVQPRFIISIEQIIYEAE